MEATATDAWKAECSGSSWASNDAAMNWPECIEEKLRVVVWLQELAAPILKLRGKSIRCWKL